MSESKAYDFQAGEVLLMKKPLEWTSFDVVNRIRSMIKRNLGYKLKVGHAGTLDPLATGLLIVCTGRSTKKIETYMGQEKEYTGTFLIGATTPCFDKEKEVDQWYPVAHITDEQIQEITKNFMGSILQVPPMFSAVRVEGKRAYDHARAGEGTVLPPRQVEIREFEITAVRRVPEAASPYGEIIEADFRVSCSKGTYIRSLARDMGKALHSGAHLSSLCRTRIGEFHLENAQTLDELGLKVMSMKKEETTE